MVSSAGSPCSAVWTFSLTVSLVSEMTSFAFSTTVPKRRRVTGLSRYIARPAVLEDGEDVVVAVA